MATLPSGLVIQGIQLGVQAVLFRPPRRIANFVAQVTIEETHVDELEITDHPVEQGARVTDHSYSRPPEVTIRCGWSNSPSNEGFFVGLAGAVTQTQAGVSDIISGNGLQQVRDIYAKLKALQDSREPFQVVTGKRTYNNMLFKSLRVETSKETENSLMVTAVLRQLLIARTQIVRFSTPAENQAAADVTQPPTSLGQKQLATAPNANMDDIEAVLNEGGTSE
jgi:hypothetical protein